ncbi:MAG: hypothetical protein IJ215_00490 [Clostridia bacterium]|nr:hypothetical protein [Clostridia bacterium]
MKSNENVQKELEIREEMNQEDAGFVEIQQEYLQEKYEEEMSQKAQTDGTQEGHVVDEPLNPDVSVETEQTKFEKEDEERPVDVNEVYGYVPPRKRRPRPSSTLKRHWNAKEFAFGILEGTLLGLSILVVFLTTYLTWHGGMSKWNYEVENLCEKMAMGTWVNGLNLIDGYDSLEFTTSDRQTLDTIVTYGIQKNVTAGEESDLKLRMKIGSIQMDYDSKNPNVFKFVNHDEIYFKNMKVTFDGLSYKVSYGVEIITLTLMTVVVLLAGLIIYYLFYLLVKKLLYGYKKEDFR